uniref:Ferredoxin n=1 Tax=Nocardioides sp. (strain KP7) TaxID=102632 RepID=Q7DJF0_NOCSK|nr:ferredoxin [Nocardioides sp.]BAA94713.1 ferredoxin [Nocardioides sp. KP7]
MRVDVDPQRCCGYRLCVETAPDVFQINAIGKAVVALDPIPTERHDAVRAAARECPGAAITLSDDLGPAQ